MVVVVSLGDVIVMMGVGDVILLGLEILIVFWVWVN